MKKILIKLKETLSKFKKKSFLSDRFSAFIRSAVFVVSAMILGSLFALKMFFPGEYVLNMINNYLFSRDMGLVAHDIVYSPLKTVSIVDGKLTKKGELLVLFDEISFAPSISGVFSGAHSGTLSVSGVNNKKGDFILDFNAAPGGCFSAYFDEFPAEFFRIFKDDIGLKGKLSGDANICTATENKKFSGEVEVEGEDFVFNGSIPTAMGPLSIEDTNLGNIKLSGETEGGVFNIETIEVDGLLKIRGSGELKINSTVLERSQININMEISVEDEDELEKNQTLSIAMSQMRRYKDNKTGAFLIKVYGQLANPRLGRGKVISGNSKSE